MPDERRRCRRVLASPAVHFLAIGAAALAGTRWLGLDAGDPSVVERTIVVDRVALRAEFRQQWGRSPDRVEERRMIRDAIDDEILYHEARARGLDRRDPLVRSRLAQLATFVDESGGETDDLPETARRLGLDRSDAVVRRYLVESMRLLASRRAPGDVVTDAEVMASFEAERDRFRDPRRYDLVHVYLARDRHGGALASDAAALLARLRREATTPERAIRLGDPFVSSASLHGATASDLDRTFGPGFAAAVADLPLGTWSGPVVSTYGVHLVWLQSRTEPSSLALAAVRNQVVHGVLRTHEQARLHRRLATLRRRYAIVVEDAATERRGARR